jgi:hypothetical protein
MAPPRKKQPTPGQGREYKIRLPEDVAQRIEAKAKVEGRPQNRIIINELASVPDLEQTHKLAALVEHMEVVIARYAAQITSHDLSDRLLSAVDAVLNAQGGALTAAIEKLRVVRAGLLAHDQTRPKRTPAK